MGVDFGGVKVADLSTEDLLIGDWEGSTLTIVSKKNPKLAVFITSVEGQNMMSEISLHDQSGIQASFTDRDSDGTWDDRSYSMSNTTYFYGRKNGHPDMIFNDDNKPLVRVGDDYFQKQLIDGKHFIERNGELIELEYIHHGYFKIKESDPVN